MNPVMAKSPHDTSLSFSKRYFNFKKKLDDEEEEGILNHSSSSHFCEDLSIIQTPNKKNSVSISKFKSVLSLFTKSPSLHYRSGLGTRVLGTLFGFRRGHVHIAFQEDPKSHPPFLIELPTPTSILVREMASGLVRIALECEKKKKIVGTKAKSVKLLEEPVWRSYCNGRKCGYANRVECGAEEWKILKALEPISMGAGVLPGGSSGSESEGELMYMRAKFERVVGSKDSEAFYLMNPDGSGGPELSIYLIRV